MIVVGKGTKGGVDLGLTIGTSEDVATDGFLGLTLKLDAPLGIGIEGVAIGRIANPILMPIDEMPTKTQPPTSMTIAAVVAKDIAIASGGKPCGFRVLPTGAIVLLNDVA